MSSEAVSQPAVTNLRCEYRIDPLGIDQARPALSWAIESARRGDRQTAFQVLVAGSAEALAGDRGDLWDTGRAASEESVHVTYEGRPLSSGARAHWKVRAWMADGRPTAWSRPAFWEMGLLAPADWVAQWIGAPWHTDDQGAGPAPHFRKSLRLPCGVRSARAYVCGLGFFELRINGRKVGDDVLVPNQTDYSRRPNLRNAHYRHEDKGAHRALYLTYDVTEHLRPGENVVGMVLGNGWYSHSRPNEGDHHYGSPRLLLQLSVELADGSRQVIASGPDWLAARGPIVQHDLFAGEVYDARRELPGWDAPGYDAARPLPDGSTWQPARPAQPPTGELRAQTAPGDRVMRTLRPVAIRALNAEAGEYLVDFGQAFAGWPRLRVRGPGGQRVEMRFADDVSGAGLGSQTGCGAYVLKGGGVEEYEPRFAWYGFRAVQLSGWPGPAPRAEDIEARVVHTAVDTAGEFRCSHDLLNRAHELFVWSQRGNMHGAVCSDCPHREKLGYTGDGQVAAEAALHTFDMASFYAKWATDMLDAQDPDNGYVPHTAPFQGGGGGAAWGSASCILPWLSYVYYGDRRVLRRHYDGMKKWVAYLGTWARDGIVHKKRPGEWSNLGDWCAPGELPPTELVDTHLYARCAWIVARSAGVLGLPQDRAEYERLYERIGQAFHARFYDAARRWYGPCGATALALAIDAPPAPLRPSVLAALADGILVGAQGHLDTGIVATPWLFEVLCREGRPDVAMTMISQTTCPGFGYWLARGATTTWEYWNGNGSHNHPMLGGGLTWLYRHLAGVQADPDEPGYRHVVVRPCPVEGVSWAGYSIATFRGRVAARWEKSPDSFLLTVALPPGCRGTVHVPARDASAVREGAGPAERAEGVRLVGGASGSAVFEIGSGEYDFVAPR